MSINQEKYYTTSDLALAVTLSLYLPIETINKIDLHKSLFIFKRDSELDKLITNYWQKKIRVEPQTYFQQIRTVKSRLYEEVQK
ncbi:MAG: hypothetical protein HY044_04285 [Candidatus Woesebacteria bacterium]|nr:MAG: hypothetical protein HY044_04285 [Candidatus Woesebacteria bacterium]